MIENKIGSIKAKKGKWQIFTHERGYRPGWKNFDKEFVIRTIKLSKLSTLKDEWIKLIQEDKYDPIKEFAKTSKDPQVSYIASLINTLSMQQNMRFAPKEEQNDTNLRRSSS